jgi:hypothetical protein
MKTKRLTPPPSVINQWKADRDDFRRLLSELHQRKQSTPSDAYASQNWLDAQIRYIGFKLANLEIEIAQYAQPESIHA